MTFSRYSSWLITDDRIFQRTPEGARIAVYKFRRSRVTATTVAEPCDESISVSWRETLYRVSLREVSAG